MATGDALADGFEVWTESDSPLFHRGEERDDRVAGPKSRCRELLVGIGRPQHRAEVSKVRGFQREI